jgi:leader peptidase (prepilin peptidase)/N-methyltransferase
MDVYLLSFTVFMFGTIVGSFLNVVILRLPVPDESIVFPPSRCPVCNTRLQWYDNIPLLSFLLLKRKCRSCGELISWQYPLVEFSMGLISLALYDKFLISSQFLIFFIYCAALLVIIFIDFYHQIIPDVISLPGIILGFACSFFNPGLTWSDSGLGILLGGGIFYGVSAGYYLFTKRIGMGGGDIKLLAMIGAFQGWQSLPFVIFASSVAGIIVGIRAMAEQKKGGRTVIPYGPFLAGAGMVYLFFEQPIQSLLRMIYQV